MDPLVLIWLGVCCPAVAGGVLLAGSLLGHESGGRGLTAVAALGSCACLLGTLSLTGFSHFDAVQWASPLTLAPLGAPGGSIISVRFDALSALWMFAMSWGTFTIAVNSRDVGTVLRGQSIAGLFGLTICQLVCLLADAWFQWAALCLVSWLLVALVWRNDDREPGIPWGTTRMLVLLVIADLSWLIALRGLYELFGDLRIESLLDPHVRAGFGSYESAVAILCCYGCLMSLAIRFGLFPLMPWPVPTSIGSHQAAQLLLLLFGTGCYVMFRFSPLVLGFEEPRTLMIGIAGLSALLLPLIALGQTPSGAWLRLGSGVLSFVWLGMATVPGGTPAMCGLAVGSTLILTVMVLLGERARLSAGVRMTLTCLLCCGILGQEWVFEAIRLGITRHEIPIPPAMSVLVPLAQGLIAFGVMRTLLRDPGPESPERSPSSMMVMTNAATVLLGLAGIAAPYLLGGELPAWRIPSVMTVCLIVAGAVHWAMGPTRSDSARGSDPRTESFVRLVQREFYVHVALDRIIVRPVRELFRGVQTAIDALLAPLLTRVPQVVMNWVAEASVAEEEESSPTSRTATILLATAVVLSAILVVGAR